MMQTCTYKQWMRACIDIMKPCHGGGRLDRKESDRRERETCLGYRKQRPIHQPTVTEGRMRHVSTPPIPSGN